MGRVRLKPGMKVYLLPKQLPDELVEFLQLRGYRVTAIVEDYPTPEGTTAISFPYRRRHNKDAKYLVKTEYLTVDPEVQMTKRAVYDPSKLTYLASPYSSGGLGTYGLNYEYTEPFVAHLLSLGHTVVSPIVYCHHLVEKYPSLGDARTAVQWWELNKKLILGCSQLLILGIPNWDKSLGVTQELEFWRKARTDLSVFLLNPETLEIQPIREVLHG